MRGFKEALDEIKTYDPATAITVSALRRWEKEGRFVSVRAGNNILINLDSLMTFLSTPVQVEKPNLTGQIRKVI